jgi:CheY-like chemotaxis protein
MTNREGSAALRRDEADPAEPAGTAGVARGAPGPRVLLLDLEPALGGLVAEWLAALGIATVQAEAGSAESLRPASLAIVDVAFPRQEGARRLQALTGALPGLPVLALSPTFFAGVAGSASVARRLGVAEVLPTPVRRDDLIAAVRRLLPAGS